MRVFLKIVFMGQKDHSFPLRSFTSVKSSLYRSRSVLSFLLLLPKEILGGAPVSPPPGESFLNLFRIFGRSPLFPSVPAIPHLPVSSSC